MALYLMMCLSVISPGPDFAFVVQSSINGTKLKGVIISIGIALSVLIHTFIISIGLNSFVSVDSYFFKSIKLFGGLYLIYLGVTGICSSLGINYKLLSSHEPQKTSHHESPLRWWKYLFKGLLCNLLNAKTILFFVVFFTNILSEESIATKFYYGIVFSGIHLLWFSGVSLFLTSEKMQKILLNQQNRIKLLFGCILLGFGWKIVFFNV